MGNGHGMGRVWQGWHTEFQKTESRVKVRMENRKVMDTNKGLGEHGSRGSGESEFWYGIAQSVTDADIIPKFH